MLRFRGLPSAPFVGALGGVIMVAAAFGCGEGLEVNKNNAVPEGGTTATDGAPLPGLPGDGGPNAFDDDAALEGGVVVTECKTLPADPIVFVTSGVYQGDRGAPAQDATVLDKLCTDLAHAAGINRTFVAYVRLDAAPPSVRLLQADQRGYVLPNGEIAWLPNASPPTTPKKPISVTERCHTLDVMDDLRVWTGETLGQTCDRWTKDTSSVGNVGNALRTDMGWEADGTAVACTELHHFYCFEQR